MIDEIVFVYLCVTVLSMFLAYVSSNLLQDKRLKKIFTVAIKIAELFP